MNEGARALDERLIKEGVAVAAWQPQLLENIVGFVILLLVKSGKEPRIIRVEPTGLVVGGG